MAGFIHRWRQGELASNSTAATVCLGLVLLVTLLAAQSLVSQRSGILIASEEGARIVKKVGEEGLERYLARAARIDYYLHEENDRPIGYSAIMIELTPDDEGAWICQGREIIYAESNVGMTVTKFTIANDLSRFSYAQTEQNIETRQVRGHLTQSFDENGIISGGFRNAYHSGPVRPYQPELHRLNLVPQVLIDLFSSVAAQEPADQGAVFVVPMTLPPVQVSPYEVHFPQWECWVRFGGSVPPEVSGQTFGGSSVTVDWIAPWHPSGDQPQSTVAQTQTIYYSRDHHLVWQVTREGARETIQRKVDRREIAEAFSDEAVAALDRWEQAPESDEEHDPI